MSSLLAIDTATEACSVALSHNGKIFQHYEVIPRLHAQKILPMIDSLLVEANISLEDIDGIAVGNGPGAFTGVRIAAGVVQGLSFALDKPVITVSNLAVLAERAHREYGVKNIAVAIDARMNEIYWGCFSYESGGLCLVDSEQVIAPSQASLTISHGHTTWYGVGTGWKYAAEIPVKLDILDDTLLPHAVDLLTLAFPLWDKGKVLQPENVEPMYLRNNVATPKS